MSRDSYAGEGWGAHKGLSYLQTGRREVRHPGAVQGPISAVKGHVVGHQPQVPRVDGDAVRAEDADDLGDDRRPRGLDAVGLAHSPNVVGGQLGCAAAFVRSTIEARERDQGGYRK